MEGRLVLACSQSEDPEAWDEAHLGQEQPPLLSCSRCPRSRPPHLQGLPGQAQQQRVALGQQHVGQAGGQLSLAAGLHRASQSAAGAVARHGTKMSPSHRRRLPGQSHVALVRVWGGSLWASRACLSLSWPGQGPAACCSGMPAGQTCAACLPGALKYCMTEAPCCTAACCKQATEMTSGPVLRTPSGRRLHGHTILPDGGHSAASPCSSLQAHLHANSQASKRHIPTTLLSASSLGGARRTLCHGCILAILLKARRQVSWRHHRGCCSLPCEQLARCQRPAGSWPALWGSSLPCHGPTCSHGVLCAGLVCSPPQCLTERVTASPCRPAGWAGTGAAWLHCLHNACTCRLPCAGGQPQTAGRQAGQTGDGEQAVLP